MYLYCYAGDTLKIPDSVMGITFLAAGTSVPEAVSSVIVAKRGKWLSSDIWERMFIQLSFKGHGSMGICNSIGSNTFDILLCLGVPWLIKAVFFPIQPGQNYVAINSAGLEYSAITLLSTLFLLYLTFSTNKFKLDKKVGTACLVMYLVFMVFASLIELNVFFRVNLPTCGRSWNWSASKSCRIYEGRPAKSDVLMSDIPFGMNRWGAEMTVFWCWIRFRFSLRQLTGRTLSAVV